MDGAADPAHFVRDGALVGVDAEPCPHRRNPVGFVSPDPGRTRPGVGQPAPQICGPTAVDQNIELELARAGLGHAADETAIDRRRGQLGGQRVQPERLENRGVAELRPQQR